jgi:hypothetical protein
MFFRRFFLLALISGGLLAGCSSEPTSDEPGFDPSGYSKCIEDASALRSKGTVFGGWSDSDIEMHCLDSNY